MWNNINFRDCPDAFFQYQFDSDLFMIKCELYSSHLLGGRVYVHSGNTTCELGSLKYDKGLLILDRTYPLSFLASNGIDEKSISHFTIETSDGNTITSYPLGNTTSTLDNVKKLLDNMKSPTNADAQKIADETKQKISLLKEINLPYLDGFKWYETDDVNEDFSLSAIRHIISVPSFVQAFEKTGKWFVGYSDNDNIFSVCINCNHRFSNPMQNALDCCVSFEFDNEIYYAVGIGLFDDGQYFVRL